MVSAIFITLHFYYFLRTILYYYLWINSFSVIKKKYKNIIDLPIYTILCPLYKEKHLVRQLIGNLSKLDYELNKLQIIILLENNDEDVIHEACLVEQEFMNLWIEIVICPEPEKNQTRTKPRALNFALPHILGEYCVVYDAEDEPEIDQLKKAVYDFRTTNHACLQACLNYRNFEENWIARMFSTEYSTWFDALIPGLAYDNMPIPLGGTSNHFRTSIINELKGWNAKNVTEDCEIGLQLSLKGYTVGHLDSTTWEEACHRFWPWIKQRTRWIKGYMYTWLHTSAKPKDIKSFISWHLFVLGTPLVTLINPILWLITLYGVFGGDISLFFPTEFSSKLGLYCLFFGNIIYIGIAMISSLKRGRKLNAILSLTFPVYWLMMSVSAYRALWQMITVPSVWEKTEHGISKKDNRKNV